MTRKQVNPMPFLRLFGRKRQTGHDGGAIPLADSEVHSDRTVNVTPLAEEPSPAPVEPEHPAEVPDDELRAVMKGLAALEGDAIALRQSGQSLAARLDAQAEALRTLHSASQEREARLRDLATTILRLADSAVSRESEAKLPDSL
jgi:GAF domain-containing protein